MRDDARVAAPGLVAIATSVLILATVPVVAFEVRPDKNLTGGLVRNGRTEMSRADRPQAAPTSRGASTPSNGCGH